MKRMTAAVLVLWGFAAPAQINAPRKSEPKTVLIFEDGEDILADPLGPMIGEISVAKRPPSKSLIRVRENFNDKLRQSVNEL